MPLFFWGSALGFEQGLCPDSLGLRLNSWPAFEKAGETSGKLLLISNGLWPEPAAHRERRLGLAGREPGRAGGGLFGFASGVPAPGRWRSGPGPWPWLPNRPAAGRSPERAGGVAHPPPPPAAGISPTPKGQRKSQAPTLYGARLLKRSQEGAGQRSRSLGQSPGPRLYGPGRLHPPLPRATAAPPPQPLLRCLSPCA